jgi:hypothetical protein
MNMPRRRDTGTAALLLLLLAACTPLEPATAPGPAAPAPGAIPPGEVRWTVTTRPAMDLWYHGLAYTGYRGPAGEIPIYPVDYVERMVAAKRAAGVHPTVLDRRAEEFRATFEAGPRYGALHFLPLYFPSGEAFFAALRTWIQVGGDPRRVQDPGTAQQVAFFSQQLPTDAERRTIASWLEVLTEEGRVFYTAHRQQEGARLAAVPPAVQAEWDRLAPRLRPVLDFLLVNQGELILSPPLGPEGRTIDLGRRFNRVAVLMPEAARPADGVWAALHEMLYPFVNGVVDDQLSPAQLRDVDRQQLGRRAAIRAAALVLAQVAPDALPAYREAHLRWVGVAVPAGAAERERAFVQAFPLPEPLPQALAQAVANIGPGF